jgi:hypothetical protein
MVNLLYATSCGLTLHFHDSYDFKSAEWNEKFTSLNDAITTAQIICNEYYPREIVEVIVTDLNTGEILAEVTPDEPEDDEPDCDWGYNEDMGYDPYLGCYTDDC